MLERRGEEATAPNLSVPGEGLILNYLQRGKYSSRWRLLEQVAYSIKGPLDVISLCGLEEQISCKRYFGVFQNTYN